MSYKTISIIATLAVIALGVWYFMRARRMAADINATAPDTAAPPPSAPAET